MEFGVFDHMDRKDMPLGQQYEERLRLVELYERAGFYAYHLAEHHSTPLGMAPSPSVFLAAVAQRTSRLRFGSLVYPLPFHHPLRAAEEISMLDQMSGGRLEVGVGRGSSPHELEYYGIVPGEAQARYFEAFAILRQALTSRFVDFDGRFYKFKNVPIELEPVQKPHPPFWYGVGSPDGMTWAAQNGINVVCNGPTSLVKTVTERYRSEWKRGGGKPDELPFVAMNRFVVIAETDQRALQIAERGYRHWHAKFFHLWNQRGLQPAYATYPDTFGQLIDLGYGVAGSVETVRETLSSQIEQADNNYLVGRFAFGDLTLEESTTSVQLFTSDVMPALRKAAA